MCAGRFIVAVAFAATVVWPAWSQNAELNCAIDDTGAIFLNGQQIIRPKKVSDPTKDTSAVPVTVRQGRNVLGVFCHDGGYLGGIIASIDLNAVGIADTIRTDTAWKCIDGRPADPAWYSDPGFDESGWRPAGEYGLLADSAGGHAMLWFQNSGLEPLNLWSHRARWLWTPKTCFIRRSFQHAGGTGSVMIRGNGVTYKIYLNGALVGEQDTVITRDGTPLARWDNRTLLSGENVIAVEAVCQDSIRMAWFKCGVQWSASGSVLSDSTWKYSWDVAQGWNNTGFNDQSWLRTGVKAAFDSRTDPLSAASWIWPTDMSFRYVFDVPTVGVRSSMVRTAVPATNAIASHEYFTLLGKRVSGQALGRLSAGGVLIERRVLPDGSAVSRTVSAAAQQWK